MNQKLSISMLFGGLGTFFTTLGEFLSQHQSWHELSGPHEVGSIIIITGSFVVTIVGALGTQMPRDKSSRVGDNIPKEDIVVTMKEKEKSDG